MYDSIGERTDVNVSVTLGKRPVMVDIAALNLLFCGVGPGGRGHGPATGDAGRPKETQDAVFIPRSCSGRVHSWVGGQLR